MTMNQRVREIRKKREMTTVEFGKAIGLSNSGISEIEKGRRTVTEKNIKLICMTFGINENWLRTGEGSMSAQGGTSIIHDLAKKNGLDDLDCAILETFIALPASARSAIKTYLHTLLSEFSKIDAAGANAAIHGHLASETDGVEDDYSGAHA